MYNKHMLTSLLGIVCTGLLLSGCVSPADKSGPQLAQEQVLKTVSPDWIADLGRKHQATQLFVVAAVGKTTAYVSLHELSADGQWKQLISTPGFIGKHGLGKTREGDGKTPVGTFHFNYAFGIADNPGCNAFTYKKVNDQDYWSGDSQIHYNQLVSISDYPKLNLADSEHLIDYFHQYQYALNVSYNEAGTAGLGSAIFLHCLGDQKPYTGGCIAIPREQMKTVMQNVRKDCVVVIDALKNLNPELAKQWGI
ncbi:MAG: L,D-transpeptidase family protein [Succinivibrio sp.]|nr:L,D-transpeptidase family protein [Succinivibrio sp.]